MHFQLGQFLGGCFTNAGRSAELSISLMHRRV
jgi:hypothetical protein